MKALTEEQYKAITEVINSYADSTSKLIKRVLIKRGELYLQEVQSILKEKESNNE